MAWVIQTSFLGDAVLTLPLVYRLLERGDHLKIIAAPRNIAIFERAKREGLSKWSDRLDIVAWNKRESRNPFKIFSLAKKWAGPQAPERVYCAQRSFSTSLLAFFSGAHERVGFSSGGATFLYTHCAPREWESNKHEIEKNMDLLRACGEVVPHWDSERAPSLLGARAPKKDVIGFSLSSPWATKIWDPSQAVALMKLLVAKGFEVWLLGEATFSGHAATFEREVDSRLVKNFVGKTKIDEWIDLIAQLSVLVSGDSAAVHVANDLDVPTIALFGPTVPDFGFAPWRRHSRALGIELVCRPCDIHGPMKCPLGHHKCMKDLKADWVESSLQEILGA